MGELKKWKLVTVLCIVQSLLLGWEVLNHQVWHNVGGPVWSCPIAWMIVAVWLYFVVRLSRLKTP